MPVIEEDWHEIIVTLGFTSEREMLNHFYVEQGFSLRDISDILGFSVFAVRRRLLENGVQMRPRGGPNRTMRKLGEVKDEELELDYRAVAKKYDVSKFTVLAERRRRKRNGVSSDSTNSEVGGVLFAHEIADGFGTGVEEGEVQTVLPGEEEERG